MNFQQKGEEFFTGYTFSNQMEIILSIKINVNSVVQPHRNSVSVDSGLYTESLKVQKLEQVSLLEDKPQLWELLQLRKIKIIKVEKVY